MKARVYLYALAVVLAVVLLGPMGVPAADKPGILRAKPVRPHVRLGEVYVEPEGDASPEAIQAGLQKGAAPLGADAVVTFPTRH